MQLYYKNYPFDGHYSFVKSKGITFYNITTSYSFARARVWTCNSPSMCEFWC